MAAKRGDTVFVHYTGKLDDGTEFDSSEGREPLEFVIGGGAIIPGFETAVEGKDAGDKVTVSIPPEQAYGMPNDEMVLIVPRSEVPDHIEPEVGMLLQIALEEGELDVAVSRVTDDEVELDGNHPLAGKTLNFDIEIVDVKPA
ncbi:MAG: peptidylprolyl isomerase [Desulfovibrio sp.]|jgi:peptidylprolyl isomerase|nr:peptidylprolyl isomerase [Desulfovibrio sp.]